MSARANHQRQIDANKQKMGDRAGANTRPLAIHQYDALTALAYKEAANFNPFEVIAPQKLSGMQRAGKMEITHGPRSIEYGPRERDVDAHAAHVQAELDTVPEHWGQRDFAAAFTRFQNEIADRLAPVLAEIRTLS